MSAPDEADPRCPECGEPIGATATYCMHCSADLTAERERADVDDDGTWDGSTADGRAASAGVDSADHGGLLAPGGFVDDALTVVVGIVGGLVVGLLGTFALLGATGSVWALPVGLVGWLVATAYLVRRRTVQAAVSRAGYAVAVALLVLPVVALGPSGDAGLGDRLAGFLVFLVVLAIPAAIAAAVGYVASRFVPEGEG